MANFPFQRLQADLAALISRTPAGSRLISEPELAKELGVSRATLREAMRTFETQGLIRRRQGSGTYVSRPSGVIETGLEILESIETMAERKGLPVSMGELKVEHRPALPDESSALSLAEGTSVIHLSRVIQAENRPVAFLIDILPDDVITPADLQSGFTGSVL